MEMVRADTEKWSTDLMHLLENNLDLPADLGKGRGQGEAEAGVGKAGGRKPSIPGADVSGSEVRKGQGEGRSSMSTIDGCVSVLAALKVTEMFEELDSSDSDSESEPEMKCDKEDRKPRKKRRKCRKRGRDKDHHPQHSKKQHQCTAERKQEGGGGKIKYRACSPTTPKSAAAATTTTTARTTAATTQKHTAGKPKPVAVSAPMPPTSAVPAPPPPKHLSPLRARSHATGQGTLGAITTTTTTTTTTQAVPPPRILSPRHSRSKRGVTETVEGGRERDDLTSTRASSGSQLSETGSGEADVTVIADVIRDVIPQLGDTGQEKARGGDHHERSRRHLYY
ncbi:uncharacterized protein LOC143276895 [Babylonia areolata]|uniref:uncharacterized protein LOC143276895 n=1 Tax=Babylonia areolata TaxID=304850 RepID=UPI003FD691B4